MLICNETSQNSVLSCYEVNKEREMEKRTKLKKLLTTQSAGIAINKRPLDAC